MGHTRGDKTPVKNYETRVAEVCSRLNDEGANYLVVGATALQLWGSARATRDIDILIEPTVENARAVLAGLSKLGLGLAREWLAEDVVRKPVTVIGDSPRVDILTVAWSVLYSHARPDARMFEGEGVEVPTISIDHLIASKRTDRLQDQADVEVLLEIKKNMEKKI